MSKTSARVSPIDRAAVMRIASFVAGYSIPSAKRSGMRGASPRIVATLLHANRKPRPEPPEFLLNC